jgi:hypothetical protein
VGIGTHGDRNQEGSFAIAPTKIIHGKAGGEMAPFVSAFQVGGLIMIRASPATRRIKMIVFIHASVSVWELLQRGTHFSLSTSFKHSSKYIILKHGFTQTNT